MKKLQSDYISVALHSTSLSGDAYVTAEELYKACKYEKLGLTDSVFQEHLSEQIREGCIHAEDRRLYAEKTWRYEEHAADRLARLSFLPPLPYAVLPETLKVGDIMLCKEQRAAVEMAVSNRLSVILGGAGSGKTTLIRGIVSAAGEDCHPVLCAPTSKAARNLTERTGLQARTVHSALGMHPDENLLEAVIWPSVRLVIVDEANMMTLEMLAGILEKVSDECRIVLIGDENQLLSVGAGNVLPDLLALDMPSLRLEENHRQIAKAPALLSNVTDFKSLHSADELAFDDSFRFIYMSKWDNLRPLAREVAERFRAGESVQVLAPYRSTVAKLNEELQNWVNPQIGDKPHIRLQEEGAPGFWDGDRVIITQNDRERNCNNGDIGILHIERNKNGHSCALHVQLPDGRCPEWRGIPWMAIGLCTLQHAYALTVHRSQGSEYDTVLLPVLPSMKAMYSRNLFYTAISRARKRVLLYGSKQVLDAVMRKEPLPRKSMLVAKTRMRMKKTA